MKKHQKNWVYDTYIVAPRGFWEGVRDGMGSYVEFWARPDRALYSSRYRSDGLRRDWEAVGSDLRAALRHRANERK